MQDARVKALRSRVVEQREARARERARRLETLLADLRLGLASGERARPEWLLDDYIFEAVGFRDPASLATFAAELDALTARRREGPLTVAERDRVVFLCRVLGRLGHTGASAPLIRFLEVARDRDLLVEAGVALCNTRDPGAYLPARQLRGRLPSRQWKQVEAVLRRIPEPEATSEAELDSAEDYYARGTSRMERGDLDGALVDFDAGIARHPDVAELFNHRGIVHRRKGNYEAALRDFTRVTELRPGMDWGHVNRGVVLRLMGRPESALKAYDRAIAISPRNPLHFAGRGHIKALLGRKKEALADFDRALQLDPESVEALRKRAVVRQQLGLPGGREDLDRAISFAPQHASLWYDRGVMRRQAGDLSGAIADFTEAIRREPRLADAYYTRAGLLARQGQRERAIADYTQTIELSHKPQAYVNRGTLYMQLDRVREALADFEQATRRGPEIWQGWLNRGVALGRLGQREQAAASMRKALEVAPASRHAHIRRTLQRLGN